MPINIGRGQEPQWPVKPDNPKAFDDGKNKFMEILSVLLMGSEPGSKHGPSMGMLPFLGIRNLRPPGAKAGIKPRPRIPTRAEGMLGTESLHPTDVMAMEEALGQVPQWAANAKKAVPKNTNVNPNNTKIFVDSLISDINRKKGSVELPKTYPKRIPESGENSDMVLERMRDEKMRLLEMLRRTNEPLPPGTGALKPKLKPLPEVDIIRRAQDAEAERTRDFIRFARKYLGDI